MEIDDKILDQLIEKSIERKALEDEIEKSVMTMLVHQHRRTVLRRWGRIVAFSLLAPMALVAFLLTTYWMVKNVEAAKYVLPGIALSVATVIAFFSKIISDFSSKEM